MAKSQKISGMTIIEVLIALLIFTIGIQGFTWLFMRTWKVNKFNLETGQMSLAASHALDDMRTLIRKTQQGDNGAYPIEKASENEIIFFSDVDNDGLAERVHFYKNGQALMMGLAKSGNTFPRQYPENDDSIKMIVDGLANASDQPIFSYFSKEYSGSESDSALDYSLDVSEIRLVKIFIRLKNPSSDSRPLEIQSMAEMRNLNDYDRLEQ